MGWQRDDGLRTQEAFRNRGRDVILGQQDQVNVGEPGEV